MTRKNNLVIQDISKYNFLFQDTYIPYDWTEDDNEAQGEWTGRGKAGPDGRERSSDTEKLYCENQLKLKKNEDGKLINEGKVFVWKGHNNGDPDPRFPGCKTRWCCQKKTRK